MATQYDPIAKDESLNTTESPSRNVADVLAEELQNIAQAIGGGGGQGGHTIVDASDTDMPQRASLQFVDAGVTDDAVDDVTKIEIVQEISAESDLNSAPDGVYQGTWDEDPSDVLTADMVGYGSGTVKDALDDADILSECSVTLISNLSAVTINKAYKYGRMVYIWFTPEFSNLPSGSDASFRIDFTNPNYYPAASFPLQGYQVTYIFMGRIESDGTVVIRNLNNITVSSSPWILLAYIAKA